MSLKLEHTGAAEEGILRMHASVVELAFANTLLATPLKRHRTIPYCAFACLLRLPHLCWALSGSALDMLASSFFTFHPLTPTTVRCGLGMIVTAIAELPNEELTCNPNNVKISHSHSRIRINLDSSTGAHAL